jgi:hypothetical protein
LYTELSRYSPHHDQFLRPLNLIIISVTTVRRRDATPPSFSATETSRADHCRAPCCLHQMPGWLNDRCSPAAAIKRSPLPRIADSKASYPSEPDTTTVFVLPPASLGHPATSSSLPAVPPLAEQVVPLSSSTTSRRSSEVDRKQGSSQVDTHDSVFGRVRVISLDDDRDVSLYRRRNLSVISCPCAHSSPSSS